MDQITPPKTKQPQFPITGYENLSPNPDAIETDISINDTPFLKISKQDSTTQGPVCIVTREMHPKLVNVFQHLATDINLTSYIYKGSENPIPNLPEVTKTLNPNGILCLLTDQITPEMADPAPNLKVVSTYSVGFDHINVPALKERNIKIGNTPGVLTEPVATFAVALLLSLARKIPISIDLSRKIPSDWTCWKPYWMTGSDVVGKTIGVVGLGRIGFSFAKKMHFGFNCPILYYDAFENSHASEIGAERTSLDDLLERSDFVSVHVPLIPETTNLFNIDKFKKMKKSALFINTSRGPVVNHDDLLLALQNDEITGAAIDVTVPEPLPPQHPLWKQSNCIVTPHIASATEQVRLVMGYMAISNLVNGITEKPLKWSV